MIEDDLTLFELYENIHDPECTGPEARRRSLRPDHRPKKTQEEILADIAEPLALEGGFNITYEPSRYEAGWLLASLRPFFDQYLITDVLAAVKGGKEAGVYRCRAHPSTGETLVAAKVYRPRKFRNLRNDRMYREGRQVLTGDGKAVKKTDHRVMRALGKKTAFGVQVAHTSWLMHEYTAMEQLHRAGAAVPRPFGAGDNAILMGYLGDEHMAAPTLNEVRPGPEEAPRLFEDLLHNLDLMLGQGWIHGDLSAYNVLYWEGEVTIIDFPQVTNPRTNTNARFILQRDVERLCQYFAGLGVESDPEGITDDLWSRHVGMAPEDYFSEPDSGLLEPDTLDQER